MTLHRNPLPDLALDASRDVLGMMLDALIDDLHRNEGYRAQKPSTVAIRHRQA